MGGSVTPKPATVALGNSRSPNVGGRVGGGGQEARAPETSGKHCCGVPSARLLKGPSEQRLGRGPPAAGSSGTSCLRLRAQVPPQGNARPGLHPAPVFAGSHGEDHSLRTGQC